MAKIKNVEHWCNFCNATTKMELAGETSEGAESTKRWAKCKKCKQKMLIDLETLHKESKPNVQNMKTDDSTTYSPAKTYSIGETIFHQGFNDFGVITGKEIMSNGKGLIVVEFQNSGKKKLLETIN